MRAIFLLVSIIALTGCSSPKIWYQPDRSAADTFRDFGTCRTLAADVPIATGEHMNGIGVFMTTQGAHKDYIIGCMNSKGYLMVPAKTVTNSAAYPRAN